AARRVFAEHGYDKASIKLIAQEAQLKSSALIYWYFENKEALLAEILKVGVPLAQLGDVTPAFFELPPEELLPRLLRMHLTAINDEEIEKIVRIFVPEALRNDSFQARFGEIVSPVFELVRYYMEMQIANGRFRPHDTAVSTRSLLAITVFYGLNKLMVPDLAEGLPEQDHYINEAVTILIRGLKNGDSHD
ncbi:MAG: TetR/AcrR family transcriptional regulator, partial [Chloroflexota bacterium]